MSTRLAQLLGARGIRLAGDLHGMSFKTFAGTRNCGHKTLHELKDFVSALQRGVQPAGAQPGSRKQVKRFHVPAEAHDFKPIELPLSLRLEKVLRNQGITRLGLLNGLPISEFWGVRQCGKKTFKELIHLVERVAAGEFQPARKAFSPADMSRLLGELDEGLDKLRRARDREILLLRLGTTEKRPPTLAAIGEKFGLTRERVRQVEVKMLRAIRKEGGPRLAAQLQGVASLCFKMHGRLTPALLSKCLGQTPSPRPYSLPFYLRLLNGLESEIPVAMR